MAIIYSLHQEKFIDEFRKIRENNFSYDGLKTLFQYLDEMSEDCGQNIEFDPIGFCCEFSEYNLEDFNEDYDLNIESFEDFDIEKHEDKLNENSIRIIDFFNDNSVWPSIEKVLVHHG